MSPYADIYGYVAGVLPTDPAPSTTIAVPSTSHQNAPVNTGAPTTINIAELVNPVGTVANTSPVTLHGPVQVPKRLLGPNATIHIRAGGFSTNTNASRYFRLFINDNVASGEVNCGTALWINGTPAGGAHFDFWIKGSNSLLIQRQHGYSLVSGTALVMQVSNLPRIFDFSGTGNVTIRTEGETPDALDEVEGLYLIVTVEPGL